MIPIELELYNFLAYRDPGPLNFEGLHIACLAGPNGAGKSSLLDAITWALWGKARVNAPDDLIHQGQTEMRVALTFDLGGSLFRVIRQRKTGKRGASLLELQGWDTETESWRGISEKTIRETQQKIDNLLRLDYETFVNSAFLVQGRADEFTTKTPGLRKQVLSNILGLSSWEDYERRARDRITETKARIHRLDGRLDEIDRELSQREMHEAELVVAETAAREVSSRLEATEKQWVSLEQTRHELVALQRQIDDLTQRITSNEREVAKVEQEQAIVKPQADKEALKAALGEVQKALNELQPIQTRHKKVAEQRTTAAEEIARLEGINQALGPETEPVKARLAVLEAATEPVCPTCGQPLTEQHRKELVADLEQEIEERREQYRDNRDRIQELQTQMNEIDHRRSELEDQLAERPSLEKRVGELETALGHADEAARRIEEFANTLVRRSSELAKDQKQREELEGQVEEAENRLRAASLSQEDLDRLRKEKRLADERVGGARQKLAALDAFEKQRSETHVERERLVNDLGLYEDLREAFGKRGVPAMIIETVVPELERSSNELLGRMTDGRMHVRIETQREIKTGELREALDIIISDELGSRPYELYSGGESFRINFAIRIALSRLLARRAGAQLRTLFIDEGFGTQDARGREHLVAAINTIQDDFDRILVITHIDELKEAFPARIEVAKTPQGSQFRFT
ncbi:MAG TPA: SMC family ATPase [Anaerolineae bacterium]|nr:SMC family ATPase [Anaerolineae bacterium]